MFTCYQSMTVQLTLGQCGVAPLDHGQDGTASGPVSRRRPPYATDCDSDSLVMSRGNKSRTTGHLLCIANWNAEGMRQKKLEFEQFLQKNNIDVCCRQETHFNNSFRFHIGGSEVYRNDRKDRPKGRVATLVRNKIPSVEISLSHDSGTEYVGVKLILGGKDLYVYTIYSQPNNR